MSRVVQLRPDLYRTSLAPYAEGYVPEVIGIYARISYDKKGQAEGVDRQIGMAKIVIRKRFPNARILEFIDNDRGASNASKDDRPEYERLISMVCTGEIQGVCVGRVDRWTRRPQEMIWSISLVRQLNLVWFDKDLKFDMTTIEGRANVQREVIRAEEEAAIIGRRTADAHYWRRVEGKHVTNRPALGYLRDCSPDDEGVLRACRYRTPDPATAWLVQALFDKASKGIPPAGLLRWLASDEVTSRYRHPALWTPQFVNHVLRNPVYCGLVPYGRKVFRDMDGKTVQIVGAKPLVDEAVWEKVQEQFESRPKVNSNGGRQRHPLAGMVICDACGHKMSAQVWAQKVKRAKADPTRGFEEVEVTAGRWTCVKRTGGCGKTARNYANVWTKVARFVEDEIDADLAGERHRTEVTEDDEWSRVITEHEGKIAKLEAGVAAGYLDEDDASRWRSEYRDVIRTAERERVKDARKREIVTTQSRDEARLLLDSDDPLSLYDKRILLRRYVDHVRILPTRKGRRIDWDSIRVVPSKG